MYQYETDRDVNVDRGSAFIIYVTGFAILAIALHVIQWNQYAFEIVPLKLKEIAGVASSDELYRESQICGKLRKTECQKNLLVKSYSLNPQNEKVAIELGQLLMRSKNYLDAIKVYSTYLRQKGTNLEARLYYAIALSELNNFKEAKKHFQHVVRVNTDFLVQADYVRTYVHYLIRNRDYVAAKAIIFETRNKQKNAAYFLEKEMTEIDSRLKKSS